MSETQRPVFAACPDSPNCVCSDDTRKSHRIEPLRLVSSTPDAWQRIEAVIRSTPRTHIVTCTHDHLRAECRSAIFGFIDDLELRLIPDSGIVAMRSASRTGYYDFGVNRRRIEKLRERLRKERIAQ